MDDKGQEDKKSLKKKLSFFSNILITNILIGLYLLPKINTNFNKN